LRYRCKECKK